MSFLRSDYEEQVELTDDAKEDYGRESVPRSDYRDYPTKAVAVLPFGRNLGELVIQQRPENGYKANYWEIVAGSKPIHHKTVDEAAQAEVAEELHGMELQDVEKSIDLVNIGEVYKNTENAQHIEIYGYLSGRRDFPGSDEVKNIEFIQPQQVAEIASQRDITDCTEAVFDELGLLEDPETNVEELANLF